MDTLQEVIKLAHTQCFDAPFDPARDNIVQLKDDGWWVYMDCVTDGHCDVYSKTGRLLTSFPTHTYASAGFVAEYMYGTNWSGYHCPGSFFIHDCAYMHGRYLWDFDYERRFMLATGARTQFFSEDPRFQMTRTWFTSDPVFVNQIWEKYVLGQGWEGLVFKNLAQPFGRPFFRKKRIFSIDYICTEIGEGGGRLAGMAGSITGSLYVDGKLTVACAIGGGFSDGERREIWVNREKYIGKVFEAYGWGLFSNITLRHPQFGRWREDKLPEECILK